MKQGRFIVFEGIDGCGKSTQYENLISHIRSENKYAMIFATKEPNNLDENGENAIRMLKSDANPYDKGIEAARFFARNRKTHNEIFFPLLEKGIDVLSDRYWHSNFAYQHAQGIDYQDIALANIGKTFPIKIPDLTIIIDLPVEESIRRRTIRDGTSCSKFEKDREFLEQVRQNYLALPEVIPRYFNEKNIRIVSGIESKERVWQKVLEEYQKRFS